MIVARPGWRNLRRLCLPVRQGRLQPPTFAGRYGDAVVDCDVPSNQRSFSDGAPRQKLSVAVVGGGASGMSAALHLAPLVSNGLIEGPVDVYDCGTEDRQIGIGIWTTAMDPFRNSDRDSHQIAYEALQRHGTQVRDVGYRTPKGAWLAKSTLVGKDVPGLLFLREMDLLASLREAVRIEEERGHVAFHRGSGQRITAIHEASPHPWSASLQCKDGKTTDRHYHLVVAADGMNSSMRRMYGGHLIQTQQLTGFQAMQGPVDIPHKVPTTHSSTSSVRVGSNDWESADREETIGIQDRGYTVFRGNSLLTTADSGMDVSFQTWGEGHSQRFAVVPMMTTDGTADDGPRAERHVWFMTTNNQDIVSEPDPATRKQKLLDVFSTWHDPICDIVEATPAEQILMDRAVAHRHCMIPITNFNQLVAQIRESRPPSSGNGPAIVFIGDAFMTIDPILAQGYTFAMEAAASLSKSLQSSLVAKPSPKHSSLAFHPHALRDELNARHERRLGRLICLLRATEAVQILGQPRSGTLTGMLSRDVVRPMMKVTPGVIKTPIFDSVLKYSLGMPMF